MELKQFARKGYPMEDHEVLDTMRMLVRQTLLLPEETAIEAHHLLFYDLGFTSMDLLDLLFRIEDRFKITIPEGTLYRIARGETSDEEFANDGLLTSVGRDRLMAILFDTPPRIFPEKIHISTLFRYCSVASLARFATHIMTGGENVRIHPVAGT
jgi:acyl carrier protein